jgi:hypothetical protein
LRRGVWFRARPAARALIGAAILYLKRGGRIKSPAMVDALKRAAEEVLRLAAPVRVLARAAKSIATNSHRCIKHYNLKAAQNADT